MEKYVDLFKNALVYTVVLSSVRAIVDDHSHSVALLVLCFIVAASLLFVLERQARLWERSLCTTNNLKGSLATLCVFMTGIGSNVAIQFTSQLVAELAAASLQSSTPNWTLFGATVSILFVYITQKVAAIAALPAKQYY